MARRRKSTGYVRIYRGGSSDLGREKADYARDKDGNKIVILPKTSVVQRADVLMIPFWHKSYKFVIDVEKDKKEVRAKVLDFTGGVTVRRFGTYRYHFEPPDRIYDGFLVVCISHAVYKPLEPLIYNWDTHLYEGQAEFLMLKNDVRPLDRIVYEYVKPDPTPPLEMFTGVANIGSVIKRYRYQVDSVCDSEYEGLIKVSASADNRCTEHRSDPWEVSERWQDFNSEISS